MAAVPGIHADRHVERVRARLGMLVRRRERLRGQRFQQDRPALVERLKEPEGKLHAGHGIGKFGPSLLVVRLDDRVGLRQRPLEADVRVHVGIGHVMYYLPNRPAPLAVGRIELRLRETGHGGTHGFWQRDDLRDVFRALLGGEDRLLLQGSDGIPQVRSHVSNITFRPASGAPRPIAQPAADAPCQPSGMRILSFLLILAAASGVAACQDIFGPGRSIPTLAGNRRVLFIGNSHTYENDLPGMVQALAREVGDTALRTGDISVANYALEDHMYDGFAARALRESGWEFVVMQQGTSALLESQLHLEYWTRQFEPLIREAGATPVMYQIWPMSSRRFDADAALTSYWNAAAAVGGILAPAGDGFTAVLAENPSIGVYSSDGLHASRRGTYLAALTIVARILEIDPETLPPRIPGVREDTTVVRALQRAANVALARSPAWPTSPRRPPTVVR